MEYRHHLASGQGDARTLTAMLAADAGHGGSVRRGTVGALQREMTGSHVSRAEAAKLGLLGGAALLGELAPGPEPAPGRRVDRAGQLALDGDALLGPFGGRIGHRD